MKTRERPGRVRLLVVAVIACVLISAPRRAEGAATVFVQFGSSNKYLANASDPGIGVAWTSESFDDTAWSAGTYGVGYETALPGAVNLIGTPVPAGTYSVYTRATFTIDDPSGVTVLSFGADYDDGYVAWINGVEVARSSGMPIGAPSWNSNSALHESSNGSAPVYGALVDISGPALPVLHAGTNVLAVGVWNSGAPTSSDLVVVPYLAFGQEETVTRGPYLQIGTPGSVMVRWGTDLATGSRVVYGPDPASLTSAAFNPGSTTEHIVTLSGLSPATRYYYAVGSLTDILAGGDPSYTFVTPPAAGTPAPTRIWVVGDSGTANASAAAVRDAYATFASGTYTNLWLMLGDNAYSGGTDAEYQSAVFDMYPETLRTTVLWPTLGNHDGHTADSATQTGPYYDIFSLPRNAEAGGAPIGDGGLLFVRLRQHPFHLPGVVRDEPRAGRRDADLAAGRGPVHEPALDHCLLAPSAVHPGLAQFGLRDRAHRDAGERPADPGAGGRRTGAGGTQSFVRTVVSARRALRLFDDLRRLDEEGRRRRPHRRTGRVPEADDRPGAARGGGVRRRGELGPDERRAAQPSGDVPVPEHAGLPGARRERAAAGGAVPRLDRGLQGLLHPVQGTRNAAGGRFQRRPIGRHRPARRPVHRSLGLRAVRLELGLRRRRDRRQPQSEPGRHVRRSRPVQRAPQGRERRRCR